MKIFMPDVSQQERVMILQESAAKVELTTYQKALSDEELTARRELLIDNIIKLNRKEDELNEIKATFKAETEPVKQINKTLLTEIRIQQTTIDGTLYHVADHTEGMMETYNHEGYMISSRRLRPEEKQGNVFQMKKAENQ